MQVQTHADGHCKMRFGHGGCTTSLEMRRRRFVFGRWNLRNSNVESRTLQKWMLRVGIYCPVSVQKASHAFTHAFGSVIYTNWRGCQFCSVYSTGNLRTSTADRQKPDTPLFFSCSLKKPVFYFIRFWVFGG